MRILVTGANGQLGNEMRILARQCNDTYVFSDVTGLDDHGGTIYLDITDQDAVRRIVRDNGIKAIVNCAAYTDVDGAENNEHMAEKLNAQAPGILAEVIKEVDGLLIHISTDYVFGLEPYNTPCKEDQKGTPTGVYGLTKLHGEHKIIEADCNHVIIRTSWLYSEFGKNFCKTMMHLTATKPELKVVFDQVGTPTYALDLAKAITVVLNDYSERHASEISSKCHLEERSDVRIPYPKTGIYHYSNEGVCSWFDFAKMIAEYTGTTDCIIRPCHSSDFPSPVKRPSYSVLDKSKIKSVFGIEIPYWTDSLKKCIINQKDN